MIDEESLAGITFSASGHQSTASGQELDFDGHVLYKLEHSEMEMEMPDLNQIQDDLGFVRRTVEGAAPPSVVSIYFLWALISLVGFALVDFAPERVGTYWTVAGPAGFLLSAFLGWRHQAGGGAVDRALGMRHMQHWGAMMLAIFLLVPLAMRGQIAGQAFGPIVLLLLGQSYFHAGLYLDSKLRWGGLLMLVGYVIVLTVTTYAWTLLGAIGFITIVILGIRESRRHAVAA